MLAGGQIAFLDPAAETALFLCGEQRDLVDLLEVGLQATFGRNGRLLGGGTRVLG